MLRLNTLFHNALSGLVCVGLVTLGAPGLTLSGARHPADHPAAKRALPKSRLLTAKESAGRRGAQSTTPEYRNPYFAGSAKWAVNMEGVDLLTGNFTMSATDLKFDGGYGIPVEITRSYSANSMEEGPFGVGWELSADPRSTAGGVLKKPGGVVHGVPDTFRERPSQEVDPNVSTQPVEAVTVVDAGGKAETIQKDVDGCAFSRKRTPLAEISGHGWRFKADTVGGNKRTELARKADTSRAGFVISFF